MDNKDEMELRFGKVGMVEVQDGKRSESGEEALERGQRPGSLSVRERENER